MRTLPSVYLVYFSKLIYVKENNAKIFSLAKRDEPMLKSWNPVEIGQDHKS